MGASKPSGARPGWRATAQCSAAEGVSGKGSWSESSLTSSWYDVPSKGLGQEGRENDRVCLGTLSWQPLDPGPPVLTEAAQQRKRRRGSRDGHRPSP